MGWTVTNVNIRVQSTAATLTFVYAVRSISDYLWKIISLHKYHYHEVDSVNLSYLIKEK